MADDETFECISRFEDPGISDDRVRMISTGSVVAKGLKLFLRNHQLLAAYDYTSLMEELLPVSKTVLATNDMEGEHIRCHELQHGQNLSELISNCQSSTAKALILINTEEANIVNSEIFEGTEHEKDFPVLLLSKSDGTELLKLLGKYNSSEVIAGVDIETEADMLTELSESLSHTQNSQDTASSEHTMEGAGVHFETTTLWQKMILRKPTNRYDLKGEVKKLMYSSEKPAIVSQNKQMFTFLMSTFSHCEKLVKSDEAWVDVSKLLRKLLKHMPSVFVEDLPFYILLAYRMQKEFRIYKCEELKSFKKFCIERMEDLSRNCVAEVFNGFMQRGDFEIMFHHDTTRSTSVFKELVQACKTMAELSRRYKKQPAVLPQRMIWVTLALRMHAEFGTQAVCRKEAEALWTKEVNWLLHYTVVLDRVTCSALRTELEFGEMIHLQPDLTLGPTHLVMLLRSDGCCRPLAHAKNCIIEVQEFLRPEDRLLELSLNLRAAYDCWLGDNSDDKLKTISENGDLAGALNEGLEFLDELYTVWNKWIPEPSDKLAMECVPWLKLLLQLIDITGDDATSHLKKFLAKNTSVCREYQNVIVSSVLHQTKVNFKDLTVCQFFPLLKAFTLWSKEFVEEFLTSCKLPPGRCITQPIWSKFINELVDRFRIGDHRYLLNFLKRVAEHYRREKRPHEFVLDLILLKTPKLFVVKTGEQNKNTQTVAEEFSAFLRDYVKSSQKSALLKQLSAIMDAITESPNNFQQQVLLVVQQEVMYLPQVTSAKGDKSEDNKYLYESLNLATSHLCNQFSVLQELTSKQKFCWGLITSCCLKIPIAESNFEWLYSHRIVFKFGYLFTNYLKVNMANKDELILPHAIPQKVTNRCSSSRKFFVWVQNIQNVLRIWQKKFMQHRINFDEIFHYASYTQELYSLGNAFACRSLVVDPDIQAAVKELLLVLFEQLNKLLLLYIPGRLDAKWCTLPLLLRDYGVSLPSRITELLSQHIGFPDESKQVFGNLLKQKLQPSIKEKFEPGSDRCCLTLTEEVSINMLAKLVDDLESFLKPLMENLGVLVFFKLLKSGMFDIYLKLQIRKALDESATINSPVKKSEETCQPSTECMLTVLVKSLSCTRKLLVEIMKGTAKYFDIIAEGKLKIETLKTEREFEILADSSSALNCTPKECTGINGIKSMLELFQYSTHICNVLQVCEQYQLNGCIQDPDLEELKSLSLKLASEEYRFALTPIIAIENLCNVKKLLCIQESESSKCLELFVAVQDSAAFHHFVWSKEFVNVDGQSRFYAIHQLITAQLQHENYDETVLNHLYVAFRYITPFMDKEQNLKQLMQKITALNATDYMMKHLETVNCNIALIQLWFSRAEGDTFQNTDQKLNCILRTGAYSFNLIDGEAEVFLRYHPSSAGYDLQLPSESTVAWGHSDHDDTHSEGKIEQWNSAQINDFVRKLGFLDASKREQGYKIKSFLHNSEIAHKLFKLYVRLRKLGHPQYLQETFTESLPCCVNRCQTMEVDEHHPTNWTLDHKEANDKVIKTEQQLAAWTEQVTSLQSKYDWLLFFSIPKMLIIYKLLTSKDVSQHLIAIVHEISFLFHNDLATRNAVTALVETFFTGTTEGNIPMEVVGQFLRGVFKEHPLPHRCEESNQPERDRISSFSNSFFQDTTKQLHICHGYTQGQLLQVIVGIYNGVPESFQVFHCYSTSTEEELRLFIRRASTYHSTLLILEVNSLPYKLQEVLIHFNLMNQESEPHPILVARSCIHFIETAPSMLRDIPGIVHEEHEVVPDDFEKCCKLCRATILQPEDYLCILLVYGSAGDGKTHYVKQLQASSPASVTIAINEAFTPLSAIKKLRDLPLTQNNCVIFFNFTILPPENSISASKDSVDSSCYAEYMKLMEVIGWFFFDLLILGYVEDKKTGLSFRIPGGLQWAIYIEVPSRGHTESSAEALELFLEEVPSLALLGTKHYIHPDTPFAVDEDVVLVCKYLKALEIGGTKGIDQLYEGRGRLVKFSQSYVTEKKCHELLTKYIPDYIRASKTTQRLFIKYMKRRCAFLDNLPDFNKNSGVRQESNKERSLIDTSKLGSTLMKAMLREASDFCNPVVNRNWASNPHQQLIYDIKGNSDSIGLITLSPDEISEADRTSYEKIGVKIPAVIDLYGRKLLDSYLSQVLNVDLEDDRLTPIDENSYVLTIDYTVKMLNIHERCECGVPVIIEGETGVGKTALVEMLSKLWNHSHLLAWKTLRKELLKFLQDSLQDIAPDISEYYPVCVQIVTAMNSGEYIHQKDLLLLCQLPDPKYGKFYKALQNRLNILKSDPVLAFLALDDNQQEVSLEDSITKAGDSPEATASLLYAVLTAQVKSTFYKINVHAAQTPSDVANFMMPVFEQARVLKKAYSKAKKAAPDTRGFVGITEHTATHTIPFVTVFLDEVNTSSCLGLFKEMIVDGSFAGEPIPENVFIVAACNPHRGNSTVVLAKKGDKEAWMRGTYYVRRLHPTLHFLILGYGALSTYQERDYINAKIKMLHKHKQMPDTEVASLTELIIACQDLMRQFAKEHLILCGLPALNAETSSSSCVSQRDIQRVFILYQWFMLTYEGLKECYGCNDFSRRAVLVSLGIVYYMRLNSNFRKKFVENLDQETKLPGRISFMDAFNYELNLYISKVLLPAGIAHTQALKENIFATIVCCVNRIPLIIVGAPGSSKTLSFNQVIANLKGQESKVAFFRNTDVFPSLDPHYYQCSRRTTSNEIETVFSRAVNRQRNHKKYKLPVSCVVFMDEAGLPEESHESLKVLHSYLDEQEVSFVAITNHVLDAAKTNRAVSLFRPEAPDEDLETLAKGCFHSKSIPELESDMKTIVKFCTPYFKLMHEHEHHEQFQNFFGLRDFIHFVNYLRRKRQSVGIMPQTVMEALERNFNGSEQLFSSICTEFLKAINSDLTQVKPRKILKILEDSLRDCPQQSITREQDHFKDTGAERDLRSENEVRYKLIIDQSEDDSIVRYLFSFGVLQRENTRLFVCSVFPGDSQRQNINTIADIRHSAIEGHTVVMSQTDDIHESFYDLFNQRFRMIDDPKEGVRYYTNIAIGAHSKPSRVHRCFQCVVVLKKSELEATPAPFLNRFEKYCISHCSLLNAVVGHMPYCMRAIIENAKAKTQDFIDCISAGRSLYGCKPETLDSLLLSVLPFNHEYQALGDLSVKNSTSGVDVYFMQEFLQALRQCAGFIIPTCPLDELSQDTKHIFALLRTDPEFDSILSGLNHKKAFLLLNEAMKTLHVTTKPQDTQYNLSPGVCMVITVFQQWLVRYLCKKLMQLMTPEALTLHRNKIPSSYMEHYLVHQSHFSLKKLISSHYNTLETGCTSCPTKLLCFTRSSPLINQLPITHPSTVFDSQVATDAQQVFDETDNLIVCKLSAVISQNFIQDTLIMFAKSDKAKVCFLVANMQETSKQVINHIRIMIEETEAKAVYPERKKLYVLLLHFPPAQFFDACYPSLFLRGWDHCYLDTIAHKAEKGVIDIQDWLLQCCFCDRPSDSKLESDSLMQTLSEMLTKSIAVLASRVCFDFDEGRSFNCHMNGTQRSRVLSELLFDKGIGYVLCAKFRAYWEPSVMVELLNRSAAMYSKNSEFTLSITHSIQMNFKALFFDFLGFMLNSINENYNLDLLFDDDCTSDVEELFTEILRVFPTPGIWQISSLSMSLSVPKSLTYKPYFPFFKLVYTSMESVVEQCHSETNTKVNILNEGKSMLAVDQVAQDLKSKLVEIVTAKLQDTNKGKVKDPIFVAVEAMEQHKNLWERYFTEFCLQKLHLESSSDSIAKQVLRVYFDAHTAQAMIVGLHSHVRVNHLEVANLAATLRPLDKLQSMHQKAAAKASVFTPSLSKNLSESLVSSMGNLTHLLESSESLAIFVIKSLFDTLIGCLHPTSNSGDASMLTQWYKAYRDVQSLPNLKQRIYRAIQSEGSNKSLIEAELNLMHAAFLVLQMSPLSDDGLLEYDVSLLQPLFARHFDEAMELKTKCPRLADITPKAVNSCADQHHKHVNMIIEGLFTYFFCAEQQSFNSDDVRWFLELANGQVQWMTSSHSDSFAEHLRIAMKMKKANQQCFGDKGMKDVEVGSLNVYKFYLERVLISKTSSSTAQDGSNPLQLYNRYIRLLVGEVLCAIPDFGPPGLYMPTFYQQCSFENLRMQQPLAHLYFLTVLEHLLKSQCKLFNLMNMAKSLQRFQYCPSDSEKVLMLIELQAVIQVVAQKVAEIIDPSNMGEVQPIIDDLNSLLSSGQGEAHGHGMVVALHMLKLLKSTRKFSELMTKRYDTICKGIDCLNPLQEQVKSFVAIPTPHLFPFMCDGADRSELHLLYQQIRRTMVGIHQCKIDVNKLVELANRSCMVHTNPVYKMLHKESRSKKHESQTGNQLRFRMLVWLVVYYEFYDKKISSEKLKDAIGSEHMASLLLDECCVRLIQTFLCPSSLMINKPEPPIIERPSADSKQAQAKDVDPLNKLFVLEQDTNQDQVDVDLRHSLANLVAIVLGSPSHSNHLWYHLFDSDQLKGTKLPGCHDRVLYDCGVELTEDGLLGRQDYKQDANRGTYSLHSLYFLLWANFGSFCISLLTQPEAEARLHGPIISNEVSVRHYCVSQLKSMWRHMRDSLGLSEEERSFFVKRLMWKFYELITKEKMQGVFNTQAELERFENMWFLHYRLTMADFRNEFMQSSKHWHNSKLLLDLKQLESRYPFFPQERDFTHSVVAHVEPPQQSSAGGELSLLFYFATEWPRLHAGGLLLPDLVELYVWIHTNLAHVVTYEKAIGNLTIGRVIELASNKPKKSDLPSLYERVKERFNNYVKMAGIALSMGRNTTAQKSVVMSITDDTPLLRLLSDDRCKEDNDWLMVVIKDIATVHNTVIEMVYTFLCNKQDHHLARLLPDKPGKVFLAEVNQYSCIMGKSTSHDDLVQLIRSRYQPPEITQQNQLLPSQHMRLQPMFQFVQLEEDVVVNFISGKPLIESAESFRIPFKFQQETQAPDSIFTNTVHTHLIDAKQKLPPQFTDQLEDALYRKIEYIFHSAGSGVMEAVKSTLSTVIRHLVMSLVNEQNSGHLEEQTMSTFMMTYYEQESREVNKEIGMSAFTENQVECLTELPLPSLWSCLELFASWVDEGFCNFSSLPYSLKCHMSDKNRLAIESDLRKKWIGTQLRLLNALKQMRDFFQQSEKQLSENVKEASQNPMVKYLKEDIPSFTDKPKLLALIPRTILLQHYVSFRLSLKRLILNMSQELEDEERMEDGSKWPRWNEAVDDLWSRVLPNLRLQVDSGADSQESPAEFEGSVSLEDEAAKYTQELVAKFLRRIKMEDYVEEFLDNDVDGEYLLAADREDLSELGVSSAVDCFKLQCLFKRVLRTGSTECSSAEVVQILEEHGLEQYEDVFVQNEIDGDMIREADNKFLSEVFKEIGIVSGVDRLKLQVLFKLSLKTGTGRKSFSVPKAVEVLEGNGLGKYKDAFAVHGISGDMILEAENDLFKEVMQEIGVTRADGTKIRKYFRHYNGNK